MKKIIIYICKKTKIINSMKSKIFILAIFLSLTNGLFAQSMTEYTWDSYKMKFEIPESFSVTESAGDKFEAGDNDITLTIYPRKDEYLSEAEMQINLLNWAKDNGLEDMTSTQDAELNDYWGYFVEGYVDDFPVLLILIEDPDYPEISLYVWISYREDAEDTAMKILKSFVPN